MSLKKVTMVAAMVAVFGASSIFESSAAVETSSNYAKVAKNEPVVENARTSTDEDLENSEVDYEDFDEVQENRSQGQGLSADTAVKYFKGFASLLALMYKFGGGFGKPKPETVQLKEEPRKRFSEAQDRFEFPQKKFRYQDKENDQQFQPVENYPPYNPLTANAADTYDAKKTSYDADLSHYDGSKNSIADYSSDVQIQQSHSYDFPYEASRPANPQNHDDWANQMRPVYRPWMSGTPSGTPNDDVSGDSYQPWNNQPSKDSGGKPWKPEMMEPDTEADPVPRQPWKDEPPTDHFPIYHHDFQGPPPDDHHLEHHPIDEDRVNKKPYSYYFLGRKLWYVPLLFSVYFIIYIGALVLKSVARHKIQFPDKIWNLHEDHFVHGDHRRHRGLDQVTEKYEKALENINNKFM